MARRTVTLLGPSKTESMSGYRVGVAVGELKQLRLDGTPDEAAMITPGHADHRGCPDADAAAAA